MSDEDVKRETTQTTYEVWYEVLQVGGKWYHSRSMELPTEAAALELFEGSFNTPDFRNVQIVKVRRDVIWQRGEYGSATTIVSTV